MRHPISSLTSLPSWSLSLCSGVAAMALAGCGQTQEPGYYNPAPASTTRDAIQTAEGGIGRGTVQAPSQIQIKFQGGQGQTDKDTTTVQVTDELTVAGQARMRQDTEQNKRTAQNTLLSDPETFFGTLPCFHQDMQCTAQQVTLTLAPNGRWRARVSYLQDQQPSGQAETAQGCWRALMTRPPTIILLDGNENVRAQLRMTAGDVLRLQSMDGQTPNLTYTLNRQPDLDPISELDAVASPTCD